MTPQYQDRNQQSGRQGDQSPAANTTFLADAVKNGIDDAFIKAAEQFAEKHLNGPHVSKSQIRNVYGSIMKIQGRLRVASDSEYAKTGWLEDLRMLIPRISYAANRSGKIKDYADLVKKAINVVSGHPEPQRIKAFERFCKGMEAILAWHNVK
ncbi:MAG TPA: type III-A CRISPR-associated protein Csm2 [Candidatus Sumerlaeota bacterium]|nr:type III-A CRISPR-associated protein Csm2 [Candidatus Sumerlaeota bacterium]